MDKQGIETETEPLSGEQSKLENYDKLLKLRKMKKEWKMYQTYYPGFAR